MPRISRFDIYRQLIHRSHLPPHDEGGFFDFADNFGGYPALELVYIIPPRVCPRKPCQSRFRPFALFV